ncbi:MAG: carboxypeptidase-like regulatory domain-containing protein [Candidatus Eisenbacteria bacterium]
MGLSSPRGEARAPVAGWVRRRILWRPRIMLLAAAVAAAFGCGDGARTIFVPIAYVVAGRVADPTQSPIAGIARARVIVETASGVAAVTSDANGDFILQGVPPGTHRLRAELAGRVTTITYDFTVGRNVADAFVPLFTPAQVDSVLAARGAPAWDRNDGLFGLFALKSTGVPLGDAVATFIPSPGGTLVQTGEGADPIVVVGGAPGAYALRVSRGGYVWDGPYPLTLRPGVLTFAAPRARPNFNGFLFADLSSGPPVAGATATALRGPSAGTSATTNFLGQFSIVGLLRGTYVGRFEAPGFLPTLSFPQPLDQDTTLAAVVFSADSIAAWAAAGGAPAPDAALGTIVLDVRDAVAGTPIAGATVEVVGGSGFPAPQTARAPALRALVLPGLQRVFARAPGHGDGAVVDSVEVRAGEVTFGRFDLAPTAASRTAQRR